MNRYETADFYHKKGYNCAQSVIWAFESDLPVPAEIAVNMTSGFGGGTGTGELCGAITGALTVLGLMHPVDSSDPAGSKQRTTKQSKTFQAKFKEHFQYLRCQDLLRNPSHASEATPAALSMGITGHCDLMIITAVEILEQQLQALGKL